MCVCIHSHHNHGWRQNRRLATDWIDRGVGAHHGMEPAFDSAPQLRLRHFRDRAMDDRATSDRAACYMDSAVDVGDAFPSAGRVVVVSNRVAFPGSTQTGGLAQAMRSLLAERGGLWVGWSGRNSDACACHEYSEGNVRLLTMDLPAVEFQAYYGSFSNSALWPLLHGRADLVQFDDRAMEAYLAVNRRFADLLASVLRGNDTVWVHDYHLIPLASLLRARGIRCRTGFFLHTPVPNAREIALLPRHRELIGALASYDVVGVQTAPDASALAGYLCTELGAANAGPDGALVLEDGRRTRVAAFPIGIDVEAIARSAAQGGNGPARALRDSMAGRALLVGVDRLDYSKGLPQRIRAFGEMLERQPHLRGTATLLQITPESRVELTDYQQLGHEVQRLVGEVNGHYGDASWTPVRYVNRPYPHCDLTAFYRLARVGVVTPLRDGMNLVAKEFIAAQDPEDPGVLVLSQFAGAARELDSALLVNPLDTVRCADAMQRALAMPLAERQLRWGAAMDSLHANRLSHWRDSFLGALAAARSTQTTAAATISAAAAAPAGATLRRSERVIRQPASAAPSREVRSGINA